MEEGVDLKNSIVFVSHSSQDKEIADKVISYLESHNQICWIAPRDIPPGADWAESILDGIDTASGMILIVSASINDSPHIRREVERAVSNKILIYPIIIEDFQYAKWIQYYISAHQWIDATSGNIEVVLNRIFKLEEQSSQKADLEKLQHSENKIAVKDDSSNWGNRISTVKTTVVSLKTRKLKRKHILSRTLIWFLTGCGIFFLHLFILREAVNTEEPLRESFLQISGVYRYIPLYALPYALIGLIISFVNDDIFAKKVYFITTALIGVFFGIVVLVTNSLPNDLESFFLLLILPLPLFLIAGMIIAGIVTLVSRWINRGAEAYVGSETQTDLRKE